MEETFRGVHISFLPSLLLVALAMLDMLLQEFHAFRDSVFPEPYLGND